MKKSLFIRALQYAGDHPDGFTKLELSLHLGTSEWGPLQNEFGQGGNHLFSQAGSLGAHDRYWLTAKGHQLLYEINEIQEAGDNARLARKYSLFAILASAVISIIVAAIWH